MLPRKRRSVRKPSDRSTQRVRVGGLYLSAAQVRAELDRVDTRMLSLKRDMARHLPANDELRDTFGAFYDSWHRFYVDASDDWLAWSTNVDQAQNFDQELDAYRARYRTQTGLRPSAPTTSRTVNRASLGGVSLGIGGAIAGIAVLAGIGLAVYRG